MGGSISEFLESLRAEVIHHKDKRATFVLRKLAFVTALFGLASIEFDWPVKFSWLLFTVPFVSLAFDVYIFAEDYKIKRVGAFCRIYRYATIAERNWERFVNQHREPVAVWASLILTAIAVIASTLILYVQNSAVKESEAVTWSMWVLYIWLLIVSALTFVVFRYYRWLLSKLPKSHLSEQQTSELIAASGESSTDGGLRDKAIIVLILNTGISKKELVALEVEDLDRKHNGEPALRIGGRKACLERLVPYREPQEILGTLEEWKEKAPIAEGLVFPSDTGQPERPGKMRPHQIDEILKRYPIVIDGTIRPVTSDELRCTYARRLYDDGVRLMTIKRYLGCTDVKPALGYIGPIAMRHELEQMSLDALEAVFPEVLDSIQEDEFDSHDFVLHLARDYQGQYVKVLAAHAHTDRPFQIVRGEIARRLLNHEDLVVKTGETTSDDFLGQPNLCASWRKAG